MPDVKKQHYVPQFYLKQFASPDERLYAFNKFTKKSFQTRVRDAASEMRFYDIHPDFYQNLQANNCFQESKDEPKVTNIPAQPPLTP